MMQFWYVYTIITCAEIRIAVHPCCAAVLNLLVLDFEDLQFGTRNFGICMNSNILLFCAS